jgi:hypothetical protein
VGKANEPGYPGLVKAATSKRRVDVGEITLAWGDRTRWKAELRDESLRRHLALPVAERLRLAFSLVLPRRP